MQPLNVAAGLLCAAFAQLVAVAMRDSGHG
jgi:hypothetical protein